MLKHLIITFARNLKKYKIYSLINILGLTTGMSVALIIGLWITDEIRYNRFPFNRLKLPTRILFEHCDTNSLELGGRS